MTSTTQAVLALDVGERRIGVAVASLEARIANPLSTLDRQDEGDIFTRINSLVQQHQAHAVVVGLPRGMAGQETAQTISTRNFAATLEKSITIPVYMQDEAGTSLAAEAELKKIKKPYQKGDIDKLAATYILSDWLAEQERNI